MLLTTVHTIINVYENADCDIWTAKQYIERNSDSHITVTGNPGSRQIRACLWTESENSPADYRTIALSLQNQGFGVEFHRG